MTTNRKVSSRAAVPTMNEPTMTIDPKAVFGDTAGSSATLADGLAVTKHVAVRMAQRGFRADDLTIIEIIGIAVLDGYFVREKECREFERNIKQMLCRV